MASSPTAMEAALKFISRTERFEGEVRKHLASFETQIVEEILEGFKRRNIVNDERALQSYVRSHSGRRATGLYKMESELRSKGVTDEVIVLLHSAISEPSAALDALSGKFRAEADQKPKMFRFLVSRGFSYESSNNAIRNFLAADVGIADRLS